MPPEQKALQGALRAEATFRDIQVAFGTQGGGGGAGGAGRDLENLADLELDREKNQYETGQQSASDSRQRRSTRRCRSWRSWRAASRSWPQEGSAAGVPPALGAGDAAPRSRTTAAADGAAAARRSIATTERAARPARPAGPEGAAGTARAAVRPAIGGNPGSRAAPAALVPSPRRSCNRPSIV